MSVAMDRAKEKCHRVGAASSVASAIPRPVEVARVEGAAARGAGAEEQEYDEASPKQILEEMRARVSPSMVWPSSKEMWDAMLKNTSPLPPLAGPRYREGERARGADLLRRVRLGLGKGRA